MITHWLSCIQKGGLDVIAGTQNSQKIIPANSMQIRNLKTIRTITTKTIGIAVITNIRINTKLIFALSSILPGCIYFYCRGLYCTCNRPYPDEEDTVPDAMIQVKKCCTRKKLLNNSIVILSVQ